MVLTRRDFLKKSAMSGAAAGCASYFSVFGQESPRDVAKRVANYVERSGSPLYEGEQYDTTFPRVSENTKYWSKFVAIIAERNAGFRCKIDLYTEQPVKGQLLHDSTKNRLVIRSFEFDDKTLRREMYPLMPDLVDIGIDGTADDEFPISGNGRTPDRKFQECYWQMLKAIADFYERGVGRHFISP